MIIYFARYKVVKKLIPKIQLMSPMMIIYFARYKAVKKLITKIQPWRYSNDVLMVF